MIPEIYEYCGLCGADLDSAIEFITGVCNACAEVQDSTDIGGDSGDGT